MLADALAATSAVDAERLHYWVDCPMGFEGFQVPGTVNPRHQVGADLGERMANAFAEMLRDPADRAIVVGTDCPELGPDTIREAFEALETSDLVLAPATDGGYVLIGLRGVAPSLFAGVDWGTDRVLEQTIERAKKAGLETALLGGFSDLDTPDDLIRFIARHATAPGPTASSTQVALRDLGLLPPPA